jgi:transcriptional regulator GlxA family with amidase domain
MSLSGFARAFQNTVGMPPHRWLLERRVERAMSMMRQTQRSMDQIAGQCGFHDACHLARVFEKIVGTTPDDWRRIIHS